ncbi:MAG: hypothetical protein JRI23_22950 [Deltaproteobacteria bacterium]|jgi:hypothetical protein|nr:hypothetical protein [Deltaproteobacteria bacterium]MBW2534828.1 hypothetical protein [Deltaproteobacteria bacterium]
MVDTQGQPALLPPLRREMLWDGSSILGMLPPVNRLRIWTAHRGRRRRIERRKRAAGPIQPIGSATGQCHVRGRAHVLRPADREPPVAAGALLTRQRRGDSANVEVIKDGRPVMTTVSRHYMEERSACGRFAVIDDTGVAIVDDAAFEIWSLGISFAATDDVTVAVRDGDTVEVIGPAERGPAPDVRDIPGHVPVDEGYRDRAPRALLFDGSAQNRVLILAPLR